MSGVVLQEGDNLSLQRGTVCVALLGKLLLLLILVSLGLPARMTLQVRVWVGLHVLASGRCV